MRRFWSYVMSHVSVGTRYGIRNLTRNYRRTLLSVAGVAIGCSIALINVGLVRGKADMYIRNVAEGGIGHIRVVPEKWITSRDPNLRLNEWQRVLARLRGNPDVAVATPRTRIQGMLAMGTRVTGVEIAGIDPETEPGVFRYVRRLETGRYLNPGDHHAMVIGRSIADRLQASVGDAIYVTVVDNVGAMKSDMFEVIGIVNLGSKQLDGRICQVLRGDVEGLIGLPGVGEIAIILKDAKLADQIRDQIRVGLPPGDTALTWAQISPQSELAVRINYGMSHILTVILVLVALLGVASSQLAAVVERKRELAVLSALGMGRSSILKLVISEALTLGTISGLVTITLAGPITYYFARVGIRILEPGKSITVLGTVVDPVMYGDFGIWFFVYAGLLSYLATLLASVYPAWFAIRLDPEDALRVG